MSSTKTHYRERRIIYQVIFMVMSCLLLRDLPFIHLVFSERLIGSGS